MKDVIKLISTIVAIVFYAILVGLFFFTSILDNLPTNDLIMFCMMIIIAFINTKD